MKFSGQTKDGAIDNLLRAYVSRPSNPSQMCPDFDPDQANAYIERSLPSDVRSQYESHLSGCAACRQNIVALVRMADADSVAPTRQVAQPTWLSGLKQVFGVMSQPQWAMAATAVIVLAVSVPLFLTRNQTLETPQPVASQSTTDNPVSAVSPAGSVSTSRSSDAPTLVAAAKQRANADDKTVTTPTDAIAPAKTAPASEFAERSDLSKKFDAKPTESADSAQRKTEIQTAPAQAGAAPVSQVGKADVDQSRQQQTEKDSAQQVAEPKIAARVDEEGAKEKSERAKAVDVTAPPPSAPARGRSGFRQPGTLALRDSNTAEAARPEERRFSGKRFLFKDGAWTDKDFNPDKDLPTVTIIRDSNVYKEVLTKRPGLKPFLTGFQATERAIIVYKGTVYKLIPQ